MPYQASSSLADRPGKPCENCGQMGHEHERVRVNKGGGRFGYRFLCPGEREVERKKNRILEGLS